KGRGRDGADLIQIDEAAVRSLGFDEIRARVSQYAKILDVVPTDGLLVRVKGNGLEGVAALPFVTAVGPYHPAYKVDTLLGKLHLIQRSRAESRVLDAWVSSWVDADPDAFRAFLEQTLGKENVGVASMDGGSYQVKIRPDQVAQVAQGDLVSRVEEVR